MRVGVVGGGIFGLAAALELRRRGHEVMVCEQGRVPDERAASTDVSKVIRRTNYLEETYIELVERAAQQWRVWHEQLGRGIYFQTGKLIMARDFTQDSSLYHSWELLGERQGGLRLLSLKEARQRFPHFALRANDTLFYDSWTGYLRSGQAMIDLAGLARASGVQICEETPVHQLEETPAEVRLLCGGETFTCDRAVIAAGAWVGRLLPQLKRHLRITRNQMAFFVPADPQRFAADIFPVWTVSSARQAWYGFPLLPEGYVKVADDLKVELADPDVDRNPTDAFMESVRQFVAERIPALASAELVGGRSCLYTNTPDDRFVIDWVPDSQRLLIAGCGSGHGFKFGGSIGPVIADALEDRDNPLGGLFRIGERFL
jgi:glycine/D-amino acid oxidase-like deaminating enzyme